MLEYDGISANKSALKKSPKKSEKGADGMEETRHNREEMAYTLLNVNQVCKALQIGRTSLYSLINARELKAIKILGRTLFRASDLIEYVHTLEEYKGAENEF